MTEIKIILHNIRSSLNVGSIFRTADGAGVTSLYLTGYTPTPTDRFGRNEATISKTALGAEYSIPWEKGEIIKTIESLRDDGYSIVGVEQTPGAKDYRTFVPKEKVAFIFGNEVNGIEQEILDLCDEVIEIPMHGEKESLNVAVVAGVILFNFLN